MRSVVNPLQSHFWSVSEQLLINHTNPWELDEALIAWGYSMGPSEAQDLVGLDVVQAARADEIRTPILPRMVAEGRLGKKCGWGFYRYPGGGGAVIDPLIEDLILEEARFTNHPRVPLDCEALVDRLHRLVAPQIKADPDAAVALLHFPVDKIDLL